MNNNTEALEHKHLCGLLEAVRGVLASWQEVPPGALQAHFGWSIAELLHHYDDCRSAMTNWKQPEEVRGQSLPQGICCGFEVPCQRCPACRRPL